MSHAALTDTAEEYLKTIFKKQDGPRGVTLTALARRADVTVPAARYQVESLVDRGLAVRTAQRGARLTAAGKKIALRLIRHHRLAERYLVDAMGFGWDEVDDEADRLEHVISEAFADRAETLLGHPRTCPHGDPIPSKDGSLPELRLRRVTDLRRGEGGPFRRSANTEPQVLRHLGSLGFAQDVPVTFVEKQPFGGPVRLRVGGKDVTLGAELSSRLYVEEPA
ncbi:MAG: metal-dependent transcriptional regulator [Candidatus Tectimicrobiota bacterium]